MTTAEFKGMTRREKSELRSDYILQAILDIGEEMVVAGAEVKRVEDSIERMCESYNLTRVNVFIITSNIQATVEDSQGKIITHIRKIERYDVNFDKLDYLNDLSRYVCSNRPEPEEMLLKLDEVMDRPESSMFIRYIGAILVAGGFALFFDGTWMDALAAGIMGMVITFVDSIMKDEKKNQIVYHFVTSVVSGLTSILLVKIGVGQDEGIIMMGGIMLLIPGIALTNAVRDMLIGDIAAGLLRLANALLVAAAIACGFAFAIFITGGIV